MCYLLLTQLSCPQILTLCGRKHLVTISLLKIISLQFSQFIFSPMPLAKPRDCRLVQLLWPIYLGEWKWKTVLSCKKLTHHLLTSKVVSQQLYRLSFKIWFLIINPQMPSWSLLLSRNIDTCYIVYLHCWRMSEQISSEIILHTTMAMA